MRSGRILEAGAPAWCASDQFPPETGLRLREVRPVKPRSGAFSIALGVSPGYGAPTINKPPKGAAGWSRSGIVVLAAPRHPCGRVSTARLLP
jgi:hypothetical protein